MSSPLHHHYHPTHHHHNHRDIFNPVPETDLFISSWTPSDYSIKPGTLDVENANNSKGNTNSRTLVAGDNNEGSSSVNDSSIDGILSDAAGDDSYHSFDDNTINKFLHDTLSLFRRKKERIGPEGPGGNGVSGLQRKTNSFRNVFGDRKGSGDTDSNGKMSRKSSFGSRTFEAKSWLREKLFGKVNSWSDMEGKELKKSINTNQLKDSNILSNRKFASNDLSMSSVRSSSSMEDPMHELNSLSCLSFQSSSNCDNNFSEGGSGVGGLDDLGAHEGPPSPVESNASSATRLLKIREEEEEEGRKIDDDDDGVGGDDSNIIAVANNLVTSDLRSYTIESDPNQKNALMFDSDDSVNFIDNDDSVQLH